MNGYFYIDDGMQYSVYGNKGSKYEISEEEAESAKQSVRWFINLPEYFTKLGVLQEKTSREEDFNGIPCVYVEMRKYDDEVLKIHISKEYGIVMNFELHTDTGEKVTYFTRTLFETGTVSDKDIELPSDVNFMEY